jgi:ribbon-helix-helix CopG family protein
MGTVVQTRVDEETKAELEKVAREQGKSVSDLVREGIRVVVNHHSSTPRRKWIGVGKHDSGMPDLSTNPKSMEGFGLDRGKRGKRR